MLVLSRRIGEEICLPDLGVTIRLIKVKGKGATVGVSAPSDIRVLRGELADFHDGAMDDDVLGHREGPRERALAVCS